jgi:hypothetical protein
VGKGGKGYTSLGCDDDLIKPFCAEDKCPVFKKLQAEKQEESKEPIYIHLTDIEKAEYEGESVITDVLLPGVGRDDSYFVPKKVKITCKKEDKSKCDECPLIESDVFVKEVVTRLM